MGRAGGGELGLGKQRGDTEREQETGLPRESRNTPREGRWETERQGMRESERDREAGVAVRGGQRDKAWERGWREGHACTHTG